MSYIEWSPGTALCFMHLITVTEKDLFQILAHENDNMSIRYLNLHGKNIDHIKKDIEKLSYTIKTFVSFADALRRSNLIYLKL